MCGRLACTLCPADLSFVCTYIQKGIEDEVLKWIEPPYIENTYDYIPLYNLAPSGVVPVLADKIHFPEACKFTTSNCVIMPMRWGMLSRNNSNPKLFHNVRIESAMESSLFKPELYHRCVVLCDGYYEWRSIHMAKQPYFIYHKKKESESIKYDWKGKPLLKLAGIFSSKFDSEGIRRYSCSIITKESDKQLSWLHDRMPIMLTSFADVEAWINHETLSCDESFEFLKSYGKISSEIEEQTFVLKYHAVAKSYVNKSSCQSEKCIEQVNIKLQNTLDNWLCKKSVAS